MFGRPDADSCSPSQLRLLFTLVAGQVTRDGVLWDRTLAADLARLRCALLRDRGRLLAAALDPEQQHGGACGAWRRCAR